MAEARCRYTVSRLEWLDEAVEIQSHAVRQAREELLNGTLRNNRGTVSSKSFDLSLCFIVTQEFCSN